MELQIGGRRLFFFDSGEVSETSPVVLLIHGFPLDHRMWQAQCETLPTHGVRVIAPDLPGFGRSEPMVDRAITVASAGAGCGTAAMMVGLHLRGGDGSLGGFAGACIAGAVASLLGGMGGYVLGNAWMRRRGAKPVSIATMSGYVATLVELLRRLGIRRPVTVAGLSMGGYVALEMAAMLPKRVAGLILCDTRCTADSPEVVNKRRETAGRILDAGSAAFLAEEMIPKLLSESSRRDRPGLAERVREMVGDVSAIGAAAAACGMAVRTDRTKTLQKIAVPTTFIVGDEDPFSPPDVMAEMQRLVPATTPSRLIRVPSAAHLAPMEAPECFPTEFPVTSP